MNTFKNNSRFNFLENEKLNSNSNDRPRNKYRNSNFNSSRNHSPKNNGFSEKIKIKKLEKERETQLSIENFPSLSSSLNNTNTNVTIDFKKGLTSIPQNEFPKETLEKGWVSYQLVDNKTVIDNNCNNFINEQDKLDDINLDIYEIMDNLCDNYEVFTNDFIKRWGNEEYENIYLFPSYDYEYFDKLDEEYEIEMEKLELQEQNDNDFE
jgi:hypothetical protein